MRLLIPVKFQQRPSFCGPGAIQNAFRTLGKRVSQKRIASAAGTTEEEGTDDYQMVEAIRRFDFVANLYETNDQIAAWAWVIESLRNERPVIIATLNWNHWVTAIGLIGNRVVVVDPTKEKFNREENGIVVQSKKEFMKRWTNATNGSCSGISIAKK